MKSGLAALFAAALAIPAVGAFATPVDPTQAPVEEEVELVEEAAAATLSEEQSEEARVLFNTWSCGACHVMADANGTGHIGPSLDGNDSMDMAFIVSRVSDGQGAMPGFGGMMTEEEIDLLSTYILEAKK